MSKFILPKKAPCCNALPLNLGNQVKLTHYYSDTISKLGRKCDPELERPPDTCSDDFGSMSLLEKMSMWGRKDFEEKPKSVLHVSDLFQGVQDLDTSEETLGSELSAYNRIIRSSAAYSWFLANMKCQSTLYWGTDQSNVMIQQIRQPILRRFPTGTISKNRPPPTFQVSLKLPWEPLKLLFDTKCLNNNTASRHNSRLAVIFTYVSDNEVQATTTKQYFEQILPHGGVKLFDSLQDLLAPSALVQGYPITRRPDGFRGLEIPSDMITDLGVTQQIRYSNSQTLLRGPHLTLELAKELDQVSLWLVLDTPCKWDPCSPRKLPHLEEDCGHAEQLDLEVLSRKYHKINSYDGAMAFWGEASSDIKSNLENATPFNAITHPRDSEASLTAALTPKYDMNDSSPSTSLDSDLLSVSSFSEDEMLSPLNDHETLLPIVKAVTARLLAGFDFDGVFKSHSELSDAGSSNKYSGEFSKSTNEASETTSPLTSCNTSSPRSSQKRKATDRDGDDSEDGSRRNRSKRARLKEEAEQKMFACPFWKLDPTKHR